MKTPAERLKAARERRKLRQLLQQEHQQHISQATHRLLNEDDLEAAKQHLAWAETAERLLPPEAKPDPKPRRPILWPMLIGLMCLVILGLMGTLKLSGAEVAIEMEVYGLSFQLTEDVQIERTVATDRIKLKTDQLMLTDVIELKALGLQDALDFQSFLAAANETGEVVELGLEGDMVEITRLDIPAQSKLSLKRTSKGFDWILKQGQLSGAVEFASGVLWLASDSDYLEEPVEAEIPETLTFQTAQAGEAPVELRSGSVSSFRLRGLSVDNLDFNEEDPPGSGKFESLILGGTVRLLETGETVTLKEADVLMLSSLKPPHRRVEIIDDPKNKRLKLIFEGYVGEIKAGPRNFERDLRPTWLEYLYREQRLAFFWSAAGFLWGLLWSIRRILFP